MVFIVSDLPTLWVRTKEKSYEPKRFDLLSETYVQICCISSFYVDHIKDIEDNDITNCNHLNGLSKTTKFITKKGDIIVKSSNNNIYISSSVNIIQ